MLAKLKKRIRNPKVLLAVVSGILMILFNLGLITEEVSSQVTEIVNTILGIGVSVGIFGNPESHVKE